jgi:hypothetical protein
MTPPKIEMIGSKVKPSRWGYRNQTYVVVVAYVVVKPSRWELLVWIVHACETNSQYFTRQKNAAALLGFSPYQKISMAMWMIAYDITTDYPDEYLRIGEDTMLKCVRMFAKVLILFLVPSTWWRIDYTPLGTPRGRYDEHSSKSSHSCETKVYRTSRRKPNFRRWCLLASWQLRTIYKAPRPGLCFAPVATWNLHTTQPRTLSQLTMRLSISLVCCKQKIERIEW